MHTVIAFVTVSARQIVLLSPGTASHSPHLRMLMMLDFIPPDTQPKGRSKVYCNLSLQVSDGKYAGLGVGILPDGTES